MKKKQKVSPQADTPWKYSINDYCWVSKRKDATLIPKSLLEAYKAKGWGLGRAPGLKVYIHKGSAVRRVAVEQADEYFSQGWSPDLDILIE